MCEKINGIIKENEDGYTLECFNLVTKMGGDDAS